MSLLLIKSWLPGRLYPCLTQRFQTFYFKNHIHHLDLKQLPQMPLESLGKAINLEQGWQLCSCESKRGSSAALLYWMTEQFTTCVGILFSIAG